MTGTHGMKRIYQLNRKGPNMKANMTHFEFSRLDRIALHLYCLLRDHKFRWHLAGVWREVTLH